MKRSGVEKLPLDVVDKYLEYDPETGDITRKITVSHNAKAGSVAGHIDSDGYRKIGILGNYYKAHRLAWLLYYGVWPDLEIDHINHHKSDNRISNLRSVSKAEQQYNRPSRKDNKSGFTGVLWHKRDCIWEAHIRVNRKRIYLGRFETVEAACAARKAAEQHYGFHENHGK